ncbi:TetR/AcrR family transcriptional regulator [Shewanella eurypsychrophilus]|uniref:TetR/AcrR family transcriptional regulator n=1 Tax=Shewanella eurypsychrophilus TaxID=2593656 RepID=A0ABX6V4T1_9GAMM|nr:MULTISPECIES: TetR/AcrR family transcriptional regulator [Shewanella]QFU22375.1 TetR family transcriptional regulator [Shewanella sp. YLB-09]QPG57662.1 TetR/AcrR family transcriptional regulator [Shewanella eurypsychrophilus]
MASGRKRNFDIDGALEKATLVFWQKGFVGASMTDLTESMGINKPSLYSTFGNKEQLFVTATEHYLAKYAAPHVEMLQQQNLSIKQRLLNYLLSVIEMHCDVSLPKGCFVSLCAAESASHDMPQSAMDAILTIQGSHQKLLTDFFKEEKAQGKLEQNFDVEANVNYIMTFIHGLAVLARSGKTLHELTQAVHVAVKVW